MNPADGRHLSEIAHILEDTTLHVWLLVRLKDREKWQNVVDATFGEQHAGRVAIADIETFVGQNISEIGGFDETRIVDALKKLFRVYNERWLPKTGGSGKVKLPADTGPCFKLLDRVNVRMDKALARFRELAESGTSDERVREQLAEVLQRWFVQGCEVTKPTIPVPGPESTSQE